MITTTFRRMPARFDIAGRLLGYDLQETAEGINQGLARRLVKHALQRLDESGFTVPDSWTVAVEAVDAEARPSDRTYCVAFRNEKGGSMGVEGIFISRHGWPTLDHGLFINA